MITIRLFGMDGFEWVMLLVGLVAIWKYRRSVIMALTNLFNRKKLERKDYKFIGLCVYTLACLGMIQIFKSMNNSHFSSILDECRSVALDITQEKYIKGLEGNKSPKTNEVLNCGKNLVFLKDDPESMFLEFHNLTSYTQARDRLSCSHENFGKDQCSDKHFLVAKKLLLK